MSTNANLKSYATTGSITGGDNHLIVASDPGFSVGDHIIVEIGTESGVGVRGTIGVGGSWPSLNYADSTARIEASPPANNTFAWDRETGAIFRYVDSSWVSFNTIYGTTPTGTNSYYYYQKAIPRSLCTTITDISGTTFTLNDAAVVTATNANVYFDNAFHWWDICKSGANDPDNNTLVISAGTFAFGDPLRVKDHDGWIIQGAGIDNTILFSPKGVGSGIIIYACNNLTIGDFTFISNFGDDGFGWYYDIVDPDPGNRPVTETVFGPTDAYGAWSAHGVWMQASTYATVRNVKVINPMTNSVAFDSNSDYSNAYDCSCYVHYAAQMYLQWLMNISNSKNCVMYDCAVYSDYYRSGFEIFGNSIDQVGNNKLVRPKSVNALMALNTTNAWQVVEPDIRFTAHSTPYSNFNVTGTPLLWANYNTTGNTVSDGGQIIKPRIIVEGPATVENDIFTAINVAAELSNITISGSYPNNCNPAGLIEYPDYVSGSGTWMPQIWLNDSTTIVDGIRIIGSQPVSQLVTHAGNVVRNCVVDVVTGAGDQSDNNQNNITFESTYQNWFAQNCVNYIVLYM